MVFPATVKLPGLLFPAFTYTSPVKSTIPVGLPSAPISTSIPFLRSVICVNACPADVAADCAFSRASATSSQIAALALPLIINAANTPIAIPLSTGAAPTLALLTLPVITFLAISETTT